MKTGAKGLALPTVMVLLSIASLAASLAMRNLWINDQLLNAEADLVRSRHLAEGVLAIAVQDITQISTSSNALGDATLDLRHTAGSGAQTHAFFPVTMADYEVLRQRLGTRACEAGICAPWPPITSTSASDWKSQIATAMAINTNDSPYGAIPAWYWVEVYPQENTRDFVYRITALTQGVLPGTRTVLQGLWVPTSPTTPATNLSNTNITAGQWQSWQILHD